MIKPLHDNVILKKEYSGTNIKIDEVDYIVIEEKDILAYIA